jgi:SAM-dependent methyltransferase
MGRVTADTDARTTVPDPDEVAAFALHVWRYRQGEVVALMIHLGDRLGLYRALDGAGPLTAAALAVRTGLQERWLLEWLRGQAAAELLRSADGATFELTPEAAAVLADEEGSLFFAAGAFGGPPLPSVVEGLMEAFRTGQGMDYDHLGPAGAHNTERQLAPWSRLALVPVVLPVLDGVVAKLEAGAAVADVGCGAGVAVLALAGAFPASRFTGYDLSRHAVERARANATARGVGNATFVHARAEDVPAGAGYDLVLTLDCLHDMTRPDLALAAVRGAIAEDGTLLVKEIRSSGSWQQDRRNPVLAMMYGFSVMTCMSSALSEPDGAGLGTLGLPPEAARRLCLDAGFSRFELHDVGDPANLYYEVRP